MASMTAKLLLIVSLLAVLALGSAYPSRVPAIFIFGDSRVDVGNNNDLEEPVIKANYFPYGIDYPDSAATGRFSNGYSLSDILATRLGFRHSPPAYFSVYERSQSEESSEEQLNRNSDILKGVNFASGGSGLLDDTGSNAVPFSRQLQYFARIKARIVSRLGEWEAKELIEKSIFVVATAENDVLEFYRQNSSPDYETTEEFVRLLLAKYKRSLKALYNHGARKFEIIDIGPLGCYPELRVSSYYGDDCVEDLNDLARRVNQRLKTLLNQLREELEDIKYSIGSYYKILQEIIDNPYGFGYYTVKEACCGSGRLNAEENCYPDASYCDDRESYLFWDRLQVTEKAAKRAGQLLYNGGNRYNYPINLRVLVEGEDYLPENSVSTN